MKKSVVSTTLALLFVAAAALSQATGEPQDQPGQTPQTPTSAAQPPTITLTGCLYREDQVPGRKPNVVERAGVLEDYILADASTTSTKANPGAGPTGATGTTPTSGNMYKVEGPPDEQLKALVGKRVEVTGRIDPEGGRKTTPGTPRPDRSPGPDEISLPEFEASTIREVTGTTCPATPKPPK